MKTPFEVITDHTIQTLSLDTENVYYTGIHSDNEELGGAYLTAERDAIDNFINHSNVSDDLDFSLYKNKKCYIMPGNSVTGQRLAEFLKEYDITITNDSSKADLFIFNKRKDNIYDPILNKNCSFYDTETYFWYIEHDLKKILKYNLESYMRENDISDSRMHAKQTYRWNSIIGGTALNILASGKPIVYEECIRKKIKTFVLDDESVESFSAMLDTRRDEDLAIVAKIIPTIDVMTNQDKVFKFILDNKYTLCGYFNRDKDVQFWLKDIHAHKFYNSNASYLIRKFHNENILTKEGFKYLEKIARGRIEIHNKEIYSFSVKIKEEYKKYLLK